MNTTSLARALASIILIGALALSACGGEGDAVSKSDAPIPGELVVARMSGDEHGALYVVAADGSAEREISGAGAFLELVLSPDGRTAAATQGAQNSQPIVLVDLATGAVSPVDVSGGSYSSPTWSPRGDALAFSGIDYSRIAGDGVVGDLIYVADAHGTHVRPLLADAEDRMAAPSWLSDGSRIVYARLSSLG